MMQKIPHEKRVRTGAVKFGDDWPGLHIRGNDAMRLLADISIVQKAAERLDMSPAEGSALHRLGLLREMIADDVVQKTSQEH